MSCRLYEQVSWFDLSGTRSDVVSLTVMLVRCGTISVELGLLSHKARLGGWDRLRSASEFRCLGVDHQHGRVQWQAILLVALPSVARVCRVRRSPIVIV